MSLTLGFEGAISVCQAKLREAEQSVECLGAWGKAGLAGREGRGRTERNSSSGPPVPFHNPCRQPLKLLCQANGDTKWWLSVCPAARTLKCVSPACKQKMYQQAIFKTQGQSQGGFRFTEHALDVAMSSTDSDHYHYPWPSNMTSFHPLGPLGWRARAMGRPGRHLTYKSQEC